MAKHVLGTVIRDCNRADIKYAQAMYKKAEKVARKERDDESCQNLLKALKLRDNHAFWAMISDGTGELGTLRRCNIAPYKWEEHFGALYSKCLAPSVCAPRRPLPLGVGPLHCLTGGEKPGRRNEEKHFFFGPWRVA
ncbi:hypothetical protein NDU88_002926 [Pleurodeles waltl]|uniref:Uncharacterized protein n=1 Tax=Pleurodeles waltl TaxID=8319 RepID=A0AAV7QAR1_PLEWA|nr:hypothetical protein NDU88_002926 [Pleurodeles waltl]